MTAVALPLRFQVGARTLVAVQRRLARVPLSLDAAIAGRLPALPALERDAHGYLVTSLPADRRAAMADAAGGMIAFARQHYTRRYIDMAGDFDGYFARLSANTRSALRRKARKVAEASGGAIDVRRYRTPDELAQFHDIARHISQRTYQERLLGGGLPDDVGFVRTMCALAAADRARGWLLSIADVPVAYLYCPIEGGVVRYDHVGHDPRYAELSPGSVLQMEALRDLFGEGTLRRFDFTEGDGQHKQQFATGGVDCVDLLLLRASLPNRLTTVALGGFDRTMALGKRTSERFGLQRLTRRLRR